MFKRLLLFTGVLFVSLLVVSGLMNSLAAAAPDDSFDDPFFDTFGVGAVQHDIVNVTTMVSGEVQMIWVSMGNLIDPPGVGANEMGAYIGFDVDQDDATGVPLLEGLCPNDVIDTGVDVFVDLFSFNSETNEAFLVETETFTIVDVVLVTYNPSSFHIDIPLVYLDDDVNMDISMAVGNQLEFTDCTGALQVGGGPTKIADVSVVKDAPTHVSPGETFVYTITVSNAGPDTSTDILFQDFLPAGVVYISHDININDGDCDYDGPSHVLGCTIYVIR